MGIGGFLGDIGDGLAHGLEKSVEGLNVVDRYINPFHQEQTLTPEGQAAFQAAQQSGTAQPHGFAAPGLEDTMQGMRWLWTNAVSHPLATTALVGKMNRGNNSAWGGDYFNSHAWGQAWRAAEHISPGQAFIMNPDEAKAAIDSPLLYYKPPEAYLPPDFSKLPEGDQQRLLKDAGMPAIGNAYVEKMRGNSAWYKYGSGALDFASIMFLDPTAVAGSIIGKSAKIASIEKAPKGGWSAEQIDSVLSQSRMQQMMGALWRNKDNSQLIMNTKLAQQSGMGGPRFANILNKLQDEDELGLFIRTGMGDGRALDELTARNALVRPRIDAAWRRLDNLGLMRSRYSNFPNVQAMVEHQMDQVTAGIQADTALVNRYDDIIGTQGLLDELHVNRWGGVMRAAEDATIAQNQYRAGAARGAVSGVIRGQRRGATIQPSQPFLTYTRHEAARDPITSGVVHSRLWGISDFFQTPVTLIRSVKNMHPNGYMRIDTLDKDSINELRGHLARIPGMSESGRANILNKYLQTTTEHERAGILDEVGRFGAAKVAQRYGVSPQIGVDLWRKHVALQQGEVAKMRERYTAALDPERSGEGGNPLHLDELPDVGGKISITPFTASRIMNGHTFQDIDELSKVLARHGGRLQTLRQATGGAKDYLESAADYTNYLWKFTTLFRLGYIPRVLGDDLASQWASAGTAAMALRTGKGVLNAFENGARWIAKPALQAREQNALNGAGYAMDEMKLLRPQIKRLDAHLAADVRSRALEATAASRRHAAAQAKLATLDPLDRSPAAMAVRKFANDRAQQLNQAQMRVAAGPSPGKTQALVDMKNQHDHLSRYHDLSMRAAEDYKASYQKVIQGSKSVKVDGVDFPAAFAGRSGAYAHDQISADTSVGNIFATNKQLVRGNLERAFNHGGVPISARQDPAAHLDAWTHAINNVIMQDSLSKLAVKGWSAQEMTRWLERDPAGQAYRARLPKRILPEEFARSAKYEVDQYMHSPELRMKAMEGPEAVTPEWLNKAFPNLSDRPDVHTGQIGLSQLSHMNALDRVIDKFYKYAATLPANRMSRHPLFNQFYEGHMTQAVKQVQKQGGNIRQMSVEQVETMAHNARQLALRDTRALVFDIAHRSDAAAALRFLSPFFSATSEAFQRWGRVIGDKPQILGYAGNWYNAPAYTGHVQDMDGNRVDDRGFTYIPQYPLKADGTPDYSKKPTVIKRLVPKSERYIITRMPKWVTQSPLGAALNIRESNGSLLLSQNSINMVTQGDPWFNPGVGPIVQIPVNEFVKDKLKPAELARRMGVLPFGVQGGTLFGENPFGRAAGIALPAAFKNFITSYDTSDQRYQQVKSQIMNRAIYEHDVLKKPMPTAKEIADRVHDYWTFAAVASFVQPFATQRKDPYQFYYDQYNALRRQNPLTADDEFLKRYEESRFVFASELSKSSGIPPTTAAVEAMKKYGSYIAKHPELGALVIGPEGKGPFSPEAYRYELNNPLVPGGSEMMRTKMSADEALKENQKRLGWAKYTARMNDLTSRLNKAGFKTFDEDGAEDFANEKRAWTQVYSNPLKPDGTANPYYNAAWAEDYNTYNPQKYNAMIPALTDIAASKLADDPRRADLRQLKQYLGGRLVLVRQLQQLKEAGEPSTLQAQQNADLRLQWAYFVDGLIEQSPSFGDLYHRYLSRDMGVDAPAEVENSGS